MNWIIQGILRRTTCVSRRTMRIILVLIFSVLVTQIVACGEDSLTTNGNPGKVDPPTPDAPPVVDDTPTIKSITLRTESPSMGSASVKGVDISATVIDTNNNLVNDVDILFSSNGGALQVPTGKTNAAGVATAILSPSIDPRNQKITVTARVIGAVAQVDTVDVVVTGTKLTASGANSLVLDSKSDVTVFLTDSVGNGLVDEFVGMNSSAGNTLSASTDKTDLNGQVQFSVTATQSGSDVISISALGEIVDFALNVSDDAFSFTVPLANELEVGVAHNVSVKWSTAGVLSNGQTVQFFTTRGELSVGSVNTVNGVASLTISSANVGPVEIFATTNTGTTATVIKEFVSSVPTSLVLQAGKSTIGPNGETSTLTAILRDENGNLVKNAVAVFSILEDVSGGSLSNSFDNTTSQGRATSIYKSTSATTAFEGVVIRASLQGVDCTIVPISALCKLIKVSVAEQKSFVSLGTGNKIKILEPTRYDFPYDVLVVDVVGNAVAGAEVILSFVPVSYITGYLSYSNGLWRRNITDVCANEDRNFNARNDFYLDVNGISTPEDINGNGKLDPGGVAKVGSGSETEVKTVITGSDGHAAISITYTKQNALWVNYKLTATIVEGATGTEFSDSVIFNLPVAVEDLRTPDVPPSPGARSPWGATSTCEAVIENVPYGVTLIPAPVAVGTQVFLNWRSSDQSISYNVYRNNIRAFPTTPAIGSTGNFQYIDGPLAAGTYYYYITSIYFDSGTLLKTESLPSDFRVITIP